MNIENYTIEEIRIFANDLLAKTYIQLGQKANANDMFQLSLVLAEDLLDDFKTLTFEDIEKSFREGIRNTDEFHLTVKVYYKWIKTFRQIIYNNETIEPQMQDKRLKYRHRQGTGMKRINIKDIKQIKQ
tara:strand:+ start:5225 stop:5611 length:387 start_codon:yes stop_codon:yes gene_type:complete